MSHPQRQPCLVAHGSLDTDREGALMASTVAEIMVATLKASGVRRVYGVPG